MKIEVKALTCFLALTFIFGFMALPVSAQQTVKTYCYLNAIPNPVGVNQEVLLHVGITMPLLSTEMGWEDLEVIITKPDNTVEKITGIRTDSTGGTGVTYIPKEAGNYTLRAHFPEQVTTETKIAGSYEIGIYPPGTVMLESYSDPLTLVVTEEPVPIYPGFPLPQEYWTRPIDSQIMEWHSVAGNWLDSSPRKPVFVTGNDYAPESPHVLWAKPLTMGGLVGDPIDEHGFEIGDAYEGKWRSRIILAGRLYYQDGAANELWQRVVCVDLHTGEEIWRKTFLDNRTIAFGQVMFWSTVNYQGVYDYLWVVVGTTWHAFDAFTGDWVFAIQNAPISSGELFWGVPDRLKFGPKGEILVYTINLQRGWMTLWNSSHISSLTGGAGFYAHSWRPYGKTVNGTEGYMWNKTIDKLPGSIHQYFGLDRVVGGLLTRTKVVLWGISLKPGEEGTLLYNETWIPPSEWEEGDLTVEFNIASAEYGVYVIRTKETRQYYGFSTKTGKYLWGPTPSEHYLNYYGWIIQPLVGERAPLIAYGRLYSTGVSGIVYCYNVTTGQLLWTYRAHDPYNEILWSNDWWLHPLFITDGKIYFGSTEHSPLDPKPRGAPFICLNATTGDEIFRVDGLLRQTWWGGMAIIGDSIIATMDTYDQRVYAIGKGPTATTIEAPNVGVPVASTIVIRGTVVDVSPGTKDQSIQLRFPDGVPAVADESMGDWMLYVYKQFPRPTDVQGVWVKLDAINVYTGEYIDIGGTHTDPAGMFTVSWNPPKEGLWTILATFPGTKSYYPSYAETSIAVTAAPAAPAAPTTTDLTIIAAILVVVALVIYTLYTVRKLKKTSA